VTERQVPTPFAVWGSYAPTCYTENSLSTRNEVCG